MGKFFHNFFADQGKNKFFWQNIHLCPILNINFPRKFCFYLWYERNIYFWSTMLLYFFFGLIKWLTWICFASADAASWLQSSDNDAPLFHSHSTRCELVRWVRSLSHSLLLLWPWHHLETLLDSRCCWPPCCWCCCWGSRSCQWCRSLTESCCFHTHSSPEHVVSHYWQSTWSHTQRCHQLCAHMVCWHYPGPVVNISLIF